MELAKLIVRKGFIELFSLTLLVATIFVFVILSNSASHAEPANASVTVGSACTASGGGQYSGNVAPGNYGEISGSTFSVVCNDANGYAIYAIGYSGDSYNSATHTDLIGTSSTGNIITNTSGTNSYWAMKVNPTSGSAPTITNDFNDYHVIPDTYTKVAQYNATTATPSSTGASVTATYKVNVSTAQVAGTYNGKVKYTMVHPNTAPAPGPQLAKPGKIVYHPNASDVVGTMGDQDANNNQSITLYASNFSRTGYGFAGWNTEFDYSGTFYGPNQTITAPSDVRTKGLSLYAVWIKSTGSMQADATTACNRLIQDPNDGTADLSSVTALTDERDNQTYAIAKLADGKCWMIENLRLEAEYTRGADNEALSQGYDSSFIGLADPEFGDYNSTVSNSLYSIDGSTVIAIPCSSLMYCRSRFPRYDNSNIQSRQSSSDYSIRNNTYSYGNYYTWPAVIADTNSNDNTYQTVDTTSICPFNWRLPKGGDEALSENNDYWNLGVAIMGFAPSGWAYPSYSSQVNAVDKTAIQVIRSFPNNYVYSGFRSNKGYSSHYWTSTTNRVNAAFEAFSLFIGENYDNIPSVYPATTYSSRYDGLAIRCLIGL